MVLTRTRLTLAACMVLAVALRASSWPVALGIDEGGVAAIARHWTGAAGTSLYGDAWLDRPPLLPALYKLALVGGAPGIRALGTVAALALVALAWDVGRRLGGPRAAAPAALVAAALASSAALSATGTPAELLAAVPAAGSIACLLARRPAAAGALAVSAVLVKQSFLDAGFAGVVALAAARDWRAARAYALGGLAPCAALAAWMALGDVRPGAVAYAVFGFRLDALHTLAASALPLQVRVRALALPALGSGLVVLGPLAVAGAVRTRSVLLGAWLAGATAGVLGGGTYWSHYLIQLAVPAAAGAGVLLAGARPALRRGALSAVAALAVAVAIGHTVAITARPPHAVERRVAAYIRTRARPGDTAYALYAKANLAYYDGLPSPFPYAWSLMVRARPGAMAELRRLLASPEAPTWIVRWQRPSHWGLDPHGTIARALRTRYRVLARIDGHPVLHRR